MDTTEKYFKMCERAHEIQNQWQPMNGDWFLAEHAVWCIGDAATMPRRADNGEIVSAVIPSEEPYGYRIWGCDEKMIWLPLQDQLQAMVCKDWGVRSICTAIAEFSKTVYGGGIAISHQLIFDGTMEKLWFAFVMLELYDKHWNDNEENWICLKDRP